MECVIRISTFLILFQLCQGLTTISPKKVFEMRCMVDTRGRDLCNVNGNSELECLRAGCCYDNPKNYITWCYRPRSIEEVEQVNDVEYNLMQELQNGLKSISDQEGREQSIPVDIQTTPSNTPQWLQMLLDMVDYFQSKNIFTTTTPTTTSTTTAATPRPQNIWKPKKPLSMIKNIALDESACIKTYKLLQSVKGDSQCSTPTQSRKPCIEGRIMRKYDESECTACTKLGCCYDPSVQGNNIPICYAGRKVKVFTVPSTQSSRLPRQTTESRPSSKNLNNFKKLMGNQGTYQGQIPSFGKGQIPQQPSGLNMAQIMAMGGANSPSSGNLININQLMGNQGAYQGQVPSFGKGQVPQQPSGLNMAQILAMGGANSPSSGNLGNLNQLMGNQGQIPNFGKGQLPQQPSGLNMAQILAMGGTDGMISGPTWGNNNNNNNLNLLGMSGGLSNLMPQVNPAFGTGFNPASNTNTGGRPSSPYGGNGGYNRPSIPGLNLPLTNTLFNGGNNNLNGLNQGNQNGFNYNKNPLLSLLTTKRTPTTTQSTTQATSATTQITVNTEMGFIASKYHKAEGKLPSKLCYPKTCGTLGGTHAQRGATQRIVGGQWSGGIDYWPWMASFRRNFTDDWRYKHVCGAALISNRWILTAGHCFVKYLSRSEKIVGKVEPSIKVFAVMLGSYYRDSPGLTSQVHALEKFIPHPEYDFKSLKHDIAVAKLQYDVTITDYVRPACLPGKFGQLEIGTRTWVTGWGDTLQVGAHNQSKLKEVSLPLVSLRECKKHWKKHFHDSWICTEGAYLEDACTGDSGGPLVHKSIDSRWDIIGVAIAGTKRCSTDRDDIRPGIYTNVAYYREFIDSATNGSC